MSSTPRPTYVSASGSLTAQPLGVRVSRTAADYGSMVYLFFETLLSPIVNPASWTNPSAAATRLSGSTRTPRPGGSNGGTGSGAGGGGGGSGGGGGGRGGGFMTMGDMTGGGTVDGCRATCG